METCKAWSLHASSTDLIKLLESFRVINLEDRVHSYLARNMLSYSKCDKIVDEINQLSTREVFLQTNLSSQAGHAELKSIYVFEVEVCCTQGTLKVNEKDAAQKDAFFHSNLVRVIWIYSKSVSVVDAKLAVFMNYESFLKQDNIYIHHALENAENVIIFLASQQVNSLVRGIKSMENTVSTMRFQLTLQEVINIILSRGSIRRWCYRCFLRDKDTPVGTIENASYRCRSAFTVGRLKEQLVEETLREATDVVIREIRDRVLGHIERHIEEDLQKKFVNLKFKISDELFASINSILVSVIVAIFHPLLGIIVAVRSLVVTLIWSVDVNSIEWRDKIADEIYETINRNKTDVLRKIEDKLQNICWGTSGELSRVLNEVYNFKRCLKETDQTELVVEWKKRDAFKNVFQKYPSVLTYLAGRRYNSPVVKVFLTGNGKKDDELKIRKSYPVVNFEFVDVDTGYEDILKNMKKIEKLEQSGPEIDKETREQMNEVIKRHAEILFANHSSVIGIEISNVRSHHGKMRNELCIVLLCLDESILPYGESPLPENLDGYPCDIREEFVMFGHCDGCQTLNIGCSIGIPLVKSAGSVGFFVRSNDSTQGISKSGFLTAAHVAIEPFDELYEHKSLLSKNPLANMSHQIVHPSYADNATNIVIGSVIESFFGNYGINGTGIDAAFIQTNQRKLKEKIHLPDENSLVFNGSMLVKKRGRTTGDTIGKLVDGCMSVRIPTKVQGRYYEFEDCFGVIQRDETQFFEKGDSGSGVFLIDEKDSSLKPLGIAFAFFCSKTAVCKIKQITDAFNVSVYEYEELMDIS